MEIQQDLSVDEKKINDILNHLTPRVKNNLSIVTPEILGQDFLLHIDLKTPGYFYPQMPRRAADSEDNTVPRVTVSDTIIDCILAYSNLEFDFHSEKNNGLYINKINFKYCLRPTSKLVYDAEVTNEHWLITYSKETVKFKPITIGKLFITSLTYTKKKEPKKYRNVDIESKIILSLDESNIKLSSNIILDKGFYEITIFLDPWDDHNIKYKKITPAEYIKQKQLHAATLSNNCLISKW